MLDQALMASVAEQMMNGTQIEVGSRIIPVRRTSSQRLKTVAFEMGGKKYQAIEQNPEKPSRWGQLAREGHRVVQIKDLENNRFVAVSVDGEVKEYGAFRQSHERAQRGTDSPRKSTP